MNLMKLHSYFLLIIISVLIIPRGAFGCYDSIFIFGDALTDSGNLFLTTSPGTNRTAYSFLLPPNGETFFHKPTGRCCDGRLIEDFIAEYLGLPLVPPYLEVKHNNQSVENFKTGANFAVVGATALDTDFLISMGSPIGITNCSLSIQMDWFKDALSSLCNTSSECSKLLSSSLITMGGIGANDYNHPLLAGTSIEDVYAYVPLVVDAIGTAITELIELGASTILSPGYLPIGCLPCYLKAYEGSDESQYNTSTGCLNWLNEFAEYHNEHLQIELSRIRSLYPNVNLIYIDYYNAMLELVVSPEQFGFNRTTTLTSCCGGGGGLYNYNGSAPCGQYEATFTVCENPAEFISWDGVHPTEATYRWMTQGILQGNYTFPTNPISTLSVSDA